MLKIKDGIELKELEKFGFVKQISLTHYLYYVNYMLNNPDTKCYIKINEKGIISIDYDMKFHGGSFTLNLDKLFELFEAGLVEKVVEE